ncbi:hypothetical protein TNCV_4290001 [Trichonephila clavipes]|nr:hypothetical protein TNCV_4290001 [Trichonephila clavipes]
MVQDDSNGKTLKKLDSFGSSSRDAIFMGKECIRICNEHAPCSEMVSLFSIRQTGCRKPQFGKRGQPSDQWATLRKISSKKIELREDLKSRRGLAVSLEIICHNCEESMSTMSSKISNKCYDVNLRLTYGMRAIGKGGAAARIFCVGS